jgi:hypothetical protein
METTLSLDDAELALLRRLVESRLGSLAVEIEHTDTRDFKDMLKIQRDALERLVGKLGGR